MSFLKKLFGEKASAAAVAPEVELPQSVSPVARRLHDVITNMCSNPGRSFSKKAHAAQLYELLGASKIPRNVADLFVETTTLTAAFTGARTDESMLALQRLCEIKAPVTDNLLHCVTQLSDTEQKLSVMDATGPSVVETHTHTTKISFAPQRSLAEAELRRRGNPKYDASCYADAGTPALRLCDPLHLGRKELDWITMIIDQSVQVEMAGDTTAMKVSAPADQLKKAISKLDQVSARCPEDLDVLVARASLLNASGRRDEASRTLDIVLARDASHFEASNWKNHPDTWADAFRFPKWDKKATAFHPVMAAHLAHGHRVQVVRNGLQKTIAIVAAVQGPPFDGRTQVKLEWLLSETPLGPLIAYYLKLIEPEGEPSVMEAFLPAFQPTLFHPMEGFFLAQQLAFTPYCFVVLVSGNDVVLNRRIILDESATARVSEIAARLAATQTYLPQDQFQAAMQWHMTNFDVTKLEFN